MVSVAQPVKHPHCKWLTLLSHRQDSKKYADTTSFVVTAVTTNLVVTVLLLQSFAYGQISRNVTARVVVTLRPSWS